MRKRIRKKLHINEYKQFGNVIVVNTDGKEESAEAILNYFETIIDKFSLTVAGGGTGRIIIPSKQSNKYIPKLAATIVTAIAQEGLTDQMMFCVYVKGTYEVPQAALDKIKETFGEGNVRVGRSIDLWHSI